MKLVAVLVVAGLAFWFIGSRIVDRGKDVNAVAQSSKDRISSVADVLRQATENAQQQGSPEDTSWQGKINTFCSEASSALHDLGTPRSPDEIATYLGKALPIVRGNHARLGSFPPPDTLASQASRAGRALLKQEALLARVRAAARTGNSTRMLDQIDRLRALARAENPNLIKLGLSDCTLPGSGLPLY